MPWFGFIHPLAALLTFVYGLRIGQVSLSKLADWDFPLRRIRTRSLRFFLFTVANLGLGLFFTAILAGQGRSVRLPGHRVLGIAVVVASLAAVFATFGKSRPGQLPKTMRWHPIATVISLALILTMGFLGLLTLVKL